LEKGGLRVGEEIALAHSPERIDFNNKKFNILNTAKIVGGVTPTCTELAAILYEKVLRAPVITVSNSATAEATKMLENTYRYVNIALVNELSTLFERLGLDEFEVIAAASTKPFGFQPFYPGPGVGGHCIPKDPHYLAFRAQQLGVTLKLVELSAQINDSMPQHIISRLDRFLADRRRSVRGSKAALLGLAFKPDVSDWRRSASIALAQKLSDLGADVRAYDPFIRAVTLDNGQALHSTTTLSQAIKDANILVLATSHSAFRKIRLGRIARQMQPKAVVVDTRGFWTAGECQKAGLDYVGIGRP
jgi:nucleotide sugar dehydrogenase